MLQRTAKSCGPDAPTLASSSRSCVGPTGLGQNLSVDDGGKQARSPGRARRKPLKPLRAGMPGDSGVLVVTRVRSTTTKCTRGCGCSGHPAFPTPSKGGRFINGSGALRGEVVNACLKNMSLPRSQPSSPANGSAEWPPDDRLRRAIQYSEAPVIESTSRGVLDTPLSRSMTVFCAERIENPSRHTRHDRHAPLLLPTLEIIGILPAKS